MDLNNLMSEAEGLAGNLGGSGGMSGIVAKLAGMAGLDAGNMEALLGKIKEMMADGKITPDDLKQQAEQLATKYNIPSSVVDKAMEEITKLKTK